MKMPCVITDCPQPQVGRGWCRNHYMQWKRTGDPLGSKPRVAKAACRICGEPVNARGLCGLHYQRDRRHGDPVAVVRIVGDDEARFWSYVDASGDCWEWTSPQINGGYGELKVDGRTVKAHRYVWELLVGPIPNGLEMDHLCRNRRCVNPDHLEPVTRAENNRRMHGARTA